MLTVRSEGVSERRDTLCRIVAVRLLHAKRRIMILYWDMAAEGSSPYDVVLDGRGAGGPGGL